GHRRLPGRLVLPAALRRLRTARAAAERQHLTNGHARDLDARQRGGTPAQRRPRRRVGLPQPVPVGGPAVPGANYVPATRYADRRPAEPETLRIVSSALPVSAGDRVPISVVRVLAVRQPIRL